MKSLTSGVSKSLSCITELIILKCWMPANPDGCYLFMANKVFLRYLISFLLISPISVSAWYFTYPSLLLSFYPTSAPHFFTIYSLLLYISKPDKRAALTTPESLSFISSLIYLSTCARFVGSSTKGRVLNEFLLKLGSL